MFASKDIFLTAPSGYTISRSVRLRSSASAWFSRTPSVAGSRTIWTWSGWVKRGTLTAYGTLFGANNNSTNNGGITIWNDDTLAVTDQISGTVNMNVKTTQVFRDPSAWYYILVAVDTTQATASNRVKIYVNGVQVTSFSTATYPSLNYITWVNSTNTHGLGALTTASNNFDGYIAESVFLDGGAATPSSFGSTNAITGVWQPIKYTGTYGTNGFYLNFSDNSASTATTIGKDYSGNGNNWTPNNISVTAGTTYDSMLDVPTPYADGGNGRGNYSVMNPLNTQSTATLLNGNLNLVTPSTSYGMSFATFGISSGKWYWEIIPTSVTGGAGIGINKTTVALTNYMGQSADSYCYIDGGQKYNNNTSTAYGSSFTNNDVIGVALDMDAGTLIFYKNNTSQGTAFSSLTGEFFPAISDQQNAASSTIVANFGQRPFTYTPPSGYVALNTQNLPTPTISNGANYMAATTYTGTGATLAISNAVNSISFQPDWVWIKDRSIVSNHGLYDSVRGTSGGYGLGLISNSTGAEVSGSGNYITTFNSNGFTASINGSTNGDAIVAWQWKAGGASSSNTNGTITSTVSVGATQGFSVVTYTGTGANATVGHGLGVAPKMIIVKNRTSVVNWEVYHATLGIGSYIYLNSTNAAMTAGATTVWNTAPTSSVFGIGTSNDVNGSTNNLVAYCFCEVAGYSKFGSYTGNGSSADGPFVYLGFRPRFILIKITSGVDNWFNFDSARGTYNDNNPYLLPNSSAAEGAFTAPEMFANGFKFNTTSTALNGSGSTYIYAAFAENPFKNSLAR